LALDERCTSIARQALLAIERSEDPMPSTTASAETASAGPPLAGAGVVPTDTTVPEALCLLKDKLVLKLPGGPGFTPHVDLSYGWHRFAKRVVNVAISFDTSDAGNSAIQVARGAHTGP